MKNIFFIETPTDAVAHGVGAYASNLLNTLKQQPDINIYYVRIIFSNTCSVVHNQLASNFRVVEITYQRPELQKRPEIVISLFVARSVFCILSGYLTNKGTHLFHLNSVLQKSVGEIAKEYGYQVVFTQHVSLWRVFYNNNFDQFLSAWNSVLVENSRDVALTSLKGEQELCRISDQVIVLSDENRSFTKSYFAIDDQKISYIKNGLVLRDYSALSREHIRKKLGFAPDDFIFIFTGRLIEQKGIGQLIAAFKELVPFLQNIRLLVVGKGNVLKYITLASECCARVAFAGYVSNETIHEFYSIADVGIMPSATEQSSYVVLEMLSHKLPVILSDIEAFQTPFVSGVHVAKVKANKEGYVFVDLLVQEMKNMYGDHTYRNRIAREGYALFMKEFISEEMAAHTMAVYNKAFHNPT